MTRAPRPCPSCRTPLDAPTPHAPFCSERCKMVDLGSWLTGGYRIPGPPVDPGEFPPSRPDGSSSSDPDA